MTEKHSSHSTPKYLDSTDHQENDELDFLSDPFSGENETTLMEKSPVPVTQQNQDLEDERFEVTEKSYVNFDLSDDEDTLIRKMKNKQDAQKNTKIQNPAQKNFLTPKGKKLILFILSPIAVLLFLGTIYIFQVLLPGFGSVINSSSDKTTLPTKMNKSLPSDLLPPQDHDIQLSELEVINEFTGLMPQIHAGEIFETEFSLAHWQTPPQKPLQFRVSVKIYNNENKLLLSQPHYKTFKQPADFKTESILISNQLRLSASTPIGVYRIVFEVIDESSQKSKTLQTPFRVLSKK